MEQETKQTIKEIFEKFDKIIKLSITPFPISFDESNFKKQYNKLKEDYLQ